MAVKARDTVFREHGMKSVRVLMAAALAATSLPLAAAQLYQWKDAQGRMVYSDQAPPSAVRDVQQKAFKPSVIEVGETYASRVAREKYPVTLYTSACGAVCDQARQLLSARGVPFATKDLQASKSAQDELQKLTGKLNVPVLVVGNDKIEGFGAAKWQAALDKAGYPQAPAAGSKPAQ
jgi:glutaredoxin